MKDGHNHCEVIHECVGSHFDASPLDLWITPFSLQSQNWKRMYTRTDWSIDSKC